MSKPKIQNPPGEPCGDGNSESNCLKNWEEDLKIISNKLTRICSKRDQAELAKNNSIIWEAKLKNYCDAVDNTVDLTDEIESVLLLFKSQTNLICENTDCLIEATEILYCLVKTSFECLDQLKDILTTVMKEVECLNLPELNPKTSIVLDCLKKLCDKVDEARANQHDLIKKLIEIIRCAHELNEMICGECCGVKDFLDKMCKAFGIEPVEGGKQSDCCPEEPGASCDICGCEIKSCIDQKLPTPEFPLDASAYYCDLKSQHEESKKEKECLQQKYNDKRKECEKLIACKVSLEEAIVASNAAKECK